MTPDLIDRRKLVEDLQRFKASLADVFFGIIVDRVIEHIWKQPAVHRGDDIPCGLNQKFEEG